MTAFAATVLHLIAAQISCGVNMPDRQTSEKTLCFNENALFRAHFLTHFFQNITKVYFQFTLIDIIVFIKLIFYLFVPCKLAVCKSSVTTLPQGSKSRENAMKIKIVCGILALIMISTGVVFALNDKQSAQPPTPPQGDTVSTLLEKPQGATPETLSAKESLFVAAGELQRSGGFTGTTVGTSTSMGVSQGVASKRTVVGHNVFKQATSYSSLVKFGEQLYIWEDNYLSRSAVKVSSLDEVQWEDTAYKYTEEAWAEKIGYRNDGLTGYILNDKSVIGATLEKKEGNMYTFRYVLDCTIAPYFVLYEMRNNSGLTGFATFSKAELVVTMDENFRVHTVTTDCEYNVPMLGGIPCKESLTETFDNFGYDGDLPEKEFFEVFFDVQAGGNQSKQPTALDVVLSMFDSYLQGEKLYAEIAATRLNDTVATAQLALTLDIQNTKNIAADVKLGESMYLSYSSGKMFVTYQDFKASTTVEGILQFIGTLSGDDLPQIDAEQLLAQMTLQTEGDKNCVTIPLQLGDISAEIKLFATKVEEKYTFTHATATLGDVSLSIVPCSQWTMPQQTGEYPEILGLTQLIQNGAISATATVGDISADVMFDIASCALHVKMGQLTATLKDNVLFAQLGQAKVRLDVDSIPQLLQLFQPLLGENIQMPQLSLQDVLAALSSVTAQKTKDGVKFSATFEDIYFEALLVSDAEGWMLHSVTVQLSDITATLQPSQNQLPQIGNADEYTDVTQMAKQFAPSIVSLLQAQGYSAEIDAVANVDGKDFRIAGNILIDGTGNVSAVADIFENGVTLANADIVFADGKIFLQINGVKAAFELPQQGETIPLQTGNATLDAIIGEITRIVNKIQNLQLSQVDFATLLGNLTYNNGVLQTTVNGAFIGVGTVDLSLWTAEEKLSAKIEQLRIADITLHATLGVEATSQQVSVPNGDDYAVNLSGSANGITFQLTADLLKGEICANVQIANDVVKLLYADGTAYIKTGNVAISLGKEQIAQLLSELGLDSSLPTTDIATILNSLQINLADSTPTLSLSVGEVTVTAQFERNENAVTLQQITANLGNFTLQAQPSTERVPPLNTDGFIDGAPLVEQIVALVRQFSQAKGVGVNVQTEITVDGKVYFAQVALRYRNGLYIDATVRQQSTTVVVAQIYFVEGTLYAEINGIRFAVDIATPDTVGSFAQTLESLKGYNDVLDSVLDTLSGITQNIENARLADIVQSLSHDGNYWRAEIDGTTLGLNKFALCFDGTPSLEVTNLALGKVTVNSLSAQITADVNEVVAPQSSYVTKLAVNIGNFATAVAEIDIRTMSAKGTVTLGNTQAQFALENGVVYLVCGQAKLCLPLDRLNQLLQEIARFTDIGTTADITLNVKDIVNSLRVQLSDNGFDLTVTVADTDVTVCFDERAQLTHVNVVFGTLDITATPTSVEIADVDTSGDFTDIVDVAQTFAPQIQQLVNAESYLFEIDGQLLSNGCTVTAKVYLNTKATSGVQLFVDATLNYKGVNALKAEIWLSDGVLYATANGLDIALDVSSSSETNPSNILSELYGYNENLDVLLDAISNVATLKDADISTLVKGFSFENGALALTFDASILGLSQFDATLCATDKLALSVNNLTVGEVSANVTVEVNCNPQAVTLPDKDFSTNLIVKIDDNNILYAQLNLLENVYRFKLGELNILYSNNVFKVQKGQDIRVMGDISVISEIVQRIDDIVKQFADPSAQQGESSALPSVSLDVKQLLDSLNLFADAQKNTLTAELQLAGIPVTVNISGGEQPQITSVTANIAALDKQISAKPNFEEVIFDDFNEESFVQIDKVLGDFLPTIDVLIHTNSWRFDFTLDSEFSVTPKDGTLPSVYRINAGSFVEFYYNRNYADMFALRAFLDVKKVVNGVAEDFATLDAMYIDGRIYITYNNTLKVSAETAKIAECVDLFDQLREVVPQIDALLNMLLSAKDDATANVQKIDYSTVIRQVAYADGKFSLTLNGGVLLNDLGDISMTVSKTQSSLVLDWLQISYGENNPYSSAYNLTLCGVAVSASDLQQQVEEGAHDRDKYAVVAHIKNYLETNSADSHINFDSIKELLKALLDTADKTTFAIDGTVTADLSLIGIIKENVEMGLNARVDIYPKDANDPESTDCVYFTVKLSRPKQSLVSLVNAAFNDYGGDSYLFFNGATQRITILRNSYVKSGWFGIKMEERNYYAEMSVEEFAQNPTEYILQMVNFSSWINNLITKHDGGDGNDLAIEDVFKNYSYQNNTFTLDLDLAPVDSNLGLLNLNILHDVTSNEITTESGETVVESQFVLTNLNGKMSLLRDMMQLSLNLDLDRQPVYGDATHFVENVLYWNQNDHTPSSVALR